MCNLNERGNCPAEPARRDVDARGAGDRPGAARALADPPFLAGPRHDRIVAPLVLEGAIDGPTFLAWVEQFLAPTLAPGDIVVADNLGSHKVAGVREAIGAQGASLLFLPSYSPDLNPIERLFAKLKTLLRGLAPRTRETLSSAIGSVIEQVSAAECANYLAHAGYGRSA